MGSKDVPQMAHNRFLSDDLNFTSSARFRQGFKDASYVKSHFIFIGFLIHFEVIIIPMIGSEQNGTRICIQNSNSIPSMHVVSKLLL